MPSLAYSVRDQKGKLVQGSSNVRTKEELVRSLQGKGLTVISIIEEKDEGAAPVKARKRIHKKVKLDDLIIFARQIAILLESGVTILKAINILSQQLESAGLLNTCKQIEGDLKTGISLRSAMAKHPRVFSPLWLDLVETGEATGQLSFVLRRVADYFEEVRTLRKKIISALIYPIILIVVSIAAIFIFMYKVIPVFAGIYKGFGKLPGLTSAVITLSEFLTRNFFIIVIFLAIIGFAFRKYINTENGRRWFDNFKLRLPILGDLFLSIAIERFTMSLGMMLKGGVSIIHALELAIRSTSNKIVEAALERVRLDVIEGKTISSRMAQMDIFPPLVTQMINVGEESGRLAQLLDEVAKFYAEDISTKLTVLMTLFEPVLLIIMGFIIGTLVVAMYLPIFAMATTTGMSK